MAMDRVWVFCALLLAACGGKSRGDVGHNGESAQPPRKGAPCWGLTEPLEDPVTPIETACSLVIASHQASLDTLFTRYSRSGPDAPPVYRGSLSMISDLPEHEGDVNQDYYLSWRGELAGDVIARIVPVAMPRGRASLLRPTLGLTLQIMDGDAQSYAELHQAQGTSGELVASQVMVFQGLSSTRLLTVPVPGVALEQAPPDIQLDFDERGELEGVLMRIRAEGTLRRLEPTDLTVNDALILDRWRVTPFVESAGEASRTISTEAYFEQEPFAGLDFTPSDCSRTIKYELVEVVDTTTLATRVRDVRVLSTELCCSLCIGPECMQSGYRRECVD